jgi:hypothetical protein
MTPSCPRDKQAGACPNHAARLQSEESRNGCGARLGRAGPRRCPATKDAARDAGAVARPGTRRTLTA